MKYWDDTEIERFDYEEGCRVLPYKHPASIVVSDDRWIETEIVPNTSEIRDVVSPYTFEVESCMCVQVERRIKRNNDNMFCEIFWVPLETMGYDKEPNNNGAAFDEAMKIV
jgi:hypothetical protein